MARERRGARGRGLAIAAVTGLVLAVVAGAVVPGSALAGRTRRPAEQYLTREQAEAALPQRLERMREYETERRQRRAGAGAGAVRRPADRGRPAPAYAAPRPAAPGDLEQ